MQNPSDDSTTDRKSPPSSPQRSPTTDDNTLKLNPTTQNSGGAEGGSGGLPSGENVKTPSQVVELTGSLGRESGHYSVAMAVGGSLGVVEGGGGPYSSQVAVGNPGQMMVVEEVTVSGGRGQKRKPSDLKDPPSGTPTCPVCHREFSSWKAAFGHMRKHPDRDYRGFFKPPVFSSTSPTSLDDQGDHGGESSNGEEQSGEEEFSPIRKLGFDLNQPIMERAESSNAAERNEVSVSPAEEKIVDEGDKLEFDLNELPAAEDE